MIEQHCVVGNAYAALHVFNRMAGESTPAGLWQHKPETSPGIDANGTVAQIGNYFVAPIWIYIVCIVSDTSWRRLVRLWVDLAVL